jgi:hypothetical protein
MHKNLRLEQSNLYGNFSVRSENAFSKNLSLLLKKKIYLSINTGKKNLSFLFFWFINVLQYKIIDNSVCLTAFRVSVAVSVMNDDCVPTLLISQNKKVASRICLTQNIGLLFSTTSSARRHDVLTVINNIKLIRPNKL